MAGSAANTALCCREKGETEDKCRQTFRSQLTENGGVPMEYPIRGATQDRPGPEDGIASCLNLDSMLIGKVEGRAYLMS